MRFFKYLTVVALALAAQGCLVVSIHPLYTPEDIVFDQALIGTWGDASGDVEAWTFEPAEGNAYRMTVNEEGKEPGHFEAHLVELGESLFLDLYPEEPECVNEFFTSHVIPARSIWRATIAGDTLSLAGLNYDWLTQEIEEGRLKVEHEKLKDLLVLTGEPHDLQMLILKHPHDVFDDDLDVAVRVK